MQIYPKELRSLKALEREKQKLHKQLQELDDEDFLSFTGKSGKKQKGEESGNGFDLSSIISMLPISNPFIATLLPILQRQIFKPGGKKRKAASGMVEAMESSHPVNKVKKAVFDVGKDVLFGYLKWKAIELSYKGVKKVLRDRREKKMAAL